MAARTLARVVIALCVLSICTVGMPPALAHGTKVAAWRMNETAGNTMYDSGAAPANNGLIHGDVTLGARGIDGSTAYRFSRGYVKVPSERSMNARRARLTLTAHANPSSLPTSGDYDIIRKGTWPEPMYKMEILQSGRLACGFNGSRHAATVTTSNALKPHTGFHKLECIKTHWHIKAVLDGSVSSKHLRIGSIHSPHPIVIGAHGAGDFDFYEGRLDKVKITIG